MQDQARIPHKVTLTVEKFTGDDTSGPPDEVTTVEQWYDADGETITDPARIAALEEQTRRTDDAGDDCLS
jgi:hypothetical protein